MTSKFDLQSYLREKEFEFHENRTHIILKHCPNCDGRDKLFISKKNHLWQCFKCHRDSEETKSGNLWKFLRVVIGLEHTQIKALLDGEEIFFTPLELSAVEEKPQSIEVAEKEDVKVYTLPSWFYHLDCSETSVKRFPEAYKYLISRHVVSKDIIKKFDLRYDPARKRLIFPAYNGDGVCVGYQGRDITNRWKRNHPKCSNYRCKLFHKYYFHDELVAPPQCPSCGGKIEEMFYPKSINSTNFPKTEFFFNQQNVDWTKPVHMVEGPFDCINTPNSIGLLGKFLSDTQFEILRTRLKSKLILFLDGDTSGTESIKDIYNKLGLFISELYVCPLDNEDDPGSHSMQDNIMKLNTYMNISEWSRHKNILYL